MTRRGRRSVLILSPVADFCATAFAHSLVEMMQHTLETKPKVLGSVRFQPYGTSILPFARQALAEYAVEQEATHTLWIDSDMKFPPDMLIRLLRREESFIGINALSRRPPFRCTARAAPGVALETRPENTGLVEVDTVGFGVAWVAPSVFAQMSKPWFEFEWAPELGVFRGEDYSFCQKAKKLDQRIWVDQDLSKEVRHVGTFGYSPLMPHMGDTAK